MNERLRRLRKNLDLTQQDFGAKISVKGNTVAQWESGRNEPSDAAILLICREFNVNEEWLRTGTGEMFIEETPDEKFMRMAKAVAAGDTRADRMIRKTLMCFYEMDDLGKETLMNFIQNLADSRQEDPADGIPKTPAELEGKYPPVNIKAKTS